VTQEFSWPQFVLQNLISKETPTGNGLDFWLAKFFTLMPLVTITLVVSHTLNFQAKSTFPSWFTFTFARTSSVNLWVTPALASTTLFYQSRVNSLPMVFAADAA